MPYIKADDGRREALSKGDTALTAGELNYQIFYYVKHQEKKGLISERVYYTIKSFVRDFLGDKPNYQKYNDMTGALIRCAKEIKRRLLVDDAFYVLEEIMESYDDEIEKYENIKIVENGDVE
jgi:hypothetical protein